MSTKKKFQCHFKRFWKSSAERHRKYWPSFLKLDNEGLNQSWPRKLKLDKQNPVNCWSFVHSGCLKRHWHSSFIILPDLTEVTVVLTANQAFSNENMQYSCISLAVLAFCGHTYLFTAKAGVYTVHMNIPSDPCVEQGAAPPTKAYRLQANGCSSAVKLVFFSRHPTSEPACCIISRSAAKMMLLR